MVDKKKQKKGVVLVIAVGTKSPKSPMKTADPDSKKKSVTSLSGQPLEPLQQYFTSPEKKAAFMRMIAAAAEERGVHQQRDRDGGVGYYPYQAGFFTQDSDMGADTDFAERLLEERMNRSFDVVKAKKPDPRLKRVGVSGYNKPKRTPKHPTKSHVVVAKEGNKVKVIRYGQQGVSGSPKKKGESKSYRKRRESFKARHAKNIKRGKMSAAYWANRSKW